MRPVKVWPDRSNDDAALSERITCAHLDLKAWSAVH